MNTCKLSQLTLSCSSLKTYIFFHILNEMIPIFILVLNLLLLVTGEDSGFGDFAYDITPIRPHTPGSVTVNGFRQCGGDGHILDWRNTECSGYTMHEHGPTTTICTVPTGILLHHEIDFRAGRTTSQLTMKFYLLEHGNFTQATEQAIDRSAVMAGHEYTMHRLWKVPSKMSGQTLTFKGILSREEDNGTEFCGLVQFHVR